MRLHWAKSVVSLCLFQLFSHCRSRRIIYTPVSYPTFDSTLCSSQYLNLHYICDPDHLLSYTDASKINKTLNHNKFVSCSYVSTPSAPNVEDWLTFGLAFAAFMSSTSASDCETYDENDEPANHEHAEVANDVADELRTRFDAITYCKYDVLIVAIKHLELCIGEEEGPSFAEYPTIGISLSDKIPKQTRTKLINAFETLTLEKQSPLLLMLKSLDVVNDILTSGESKASKLHRAESMIPTWAMIVFLVCLTLTLACTALGHWVNTGDSRGKFNSPDIFARGHLNSRRWRAGFAGGMMELHSAQANGGAGARACKSAGPARMGANGRRGKMFGAISMANKKMNSAQYNYQRV